MSSGNASRGTNGTGVSAPANHPSSRARLVAVRGAPCLRQHPRSQPAAAQELRVDRQARSERQPRRLGRDPEAVDLGPRCLWVDVVDRHRRDTAPVVDAGVEQAREVVVAEIRRHLDMDVGRQDQACDRGRPEQVVERRLGVVGHLRTRLRPEVLDDHLLDVAVLTVQRGDRLQRLDPLRPGFADPDQDPGRERDAELAGEADRLEARGGALVGRAEVRPATLRQAVGDGLQHDPLRRRDLPQRRQLVARHHAGIRVREEAGLFEDELAHPREVLDRRLAIQGGELFRATP